MRKVLFWRDIVSDMSELKDYEVTIDALLNGEYSNLSLEKLNINFYMLFKFMFFQWT